jgi:hypothetical protein
MAEKELTAVIQEAYIQGVSKVTPHPPDAAVGRTCSRKDPPLSIWPKRTAWWSLGLPEGMASYLPLEAKFAEALM